MKEVRTIIKHSAVYGSAVLLTRAVGFLLLPLYTRFLSLEDYGVIELLDLTGYVLAEFIALGIDQALMKYYHAFPDEADRRKTISTAVIFSVVSGLLFVAVLIPARHVFAREILGADHYSNLFLLSFAALFVSSVWRIERNTLRVQNRSGVFTRLSVAYTAVAILLNIYFVAYQHKGPEGIFYSTLLSASAFSLYLSWRIFRETGVHFDLTKLRPMLSYGLFFVPVGLASFVLNFADRYFLRAFSTLEEVGLYALAYKIAMIVTMLVAVPFNQVWHSYLFEIRNQPNAKEVYAKVATYFLAALAAVALGLAVLSREIIVIMAAPSYLPAHTVLPILLVAMVFFCSDNVFQVGLWLTGKSGQLSTIKWVGAIANLGLNAALIPTLGMRGAAITTLVSFALSAVLILARAQQVYWIPFEYRRILHVSAIGFVTYIVASRLPDAPLWLALVTKSLAWLLFPALLWVTSFLNSAERQKLLSMTASLRVRIRSQEEADSRAMAEAAPSRKRILFVEQNLDGTIGGSHHSLLLLVKHLDRTRFEPVVAFYQHHSLLDEYERCARVVMLPAYVPIRLSIAGGTHPVNALVLPVRKLLNLIGAMQFAASRVLAVFRIRPHLIHLNNCVLTGAEWPLAAWLCGAPTVVHQRGHAPPPWYTHFFDRVICISRDVQAALERDDPSITNRIVQIHNGIDLDAYQALAEQRSTAEVRAEFGLRDGELLIAMVGNVHEWKGQEILLRALPLLPPSVRWRCLFVGGVPTNATNQAYYAHLLELQREYALEERTSFTGYRSDVSAIVGASDVLVHTSITPEPMGRVILEGMTLGRPTIATNHGGPTEIIEHEVSGFLVAPGDPKALADCMSRVLCSPSLRARVGSAAQERVRSFFDVRGYVTRVEGVYLSFWPEMARAWQTSESAS
jgi:O-antigen/teichoic acid export membrane protein/glycosyltransferase involved in cell wall biosynthesis